MSLLAAIASTKNTLGLVKVAIDARDDAKIEAATLELRKQLFAMSDLAMGYVERNASLTQENAALALKQVGLEQKMAELEQRARDDEQYALHEFATGALALRYDPVVQPDNKPAHYLCLACKNEGRHTVLQPYGKSAIVLICQANKNHKIAAKADEPSNARRELFKPTGGSDGSW